MREINKKDRLPVWAGSWLQVAKRLMHQDYYQTQIGNSGDKIAIMPCQDEMIISKVIDPDDVVEYFEGDSMTIKMRAFDEINQILPDEGELIEGISRLKYALHKSGYHPEKIDNDHLIKFLEKLSNLYYER